MSLHVNFKVEKEFINNYTTYTVQVSDYALSVAKFDPLDRVILNAPIENATDFAQSLETLLRGIERGMSEIQNLSQ